MQNSKKNAIRPVACKTVFYFSFLLFSSNMFPQTAFFNSGIGFSANQLDGFYSSFSADSTQLYFNANDYTVYAYDKKSGILNWQYYTGNKSDVGPKWHQNSVFVGKHISEYENKCMQLNAKTGDTVQTLKIEALNTEPVFRDGIMYCTAVSPEVGGAVLAYDLRQNAIIWQKFIAHGVSAQPYYLKDKIIANAEADNWFELNYRGQLLDTTCKKKTDIFVEDIKCIRHFKYLTHNQKELSQAYFEEDENPRLKYTRTNTFVLVGNKMLIINNRNKVEKEIRPEEITMFSENREGTYAEILKATADSVWFIYKNMLIVYDYKRDKTTKTYDLSRWNVHQAILEDDNLWLISRNDGQLTGLKLD